MADSSYYYKKYKEKKQEAKDLGDNIQDIKTIKDNLTDDMYDEIRKVNNEIDDLMDDLEKGVRENSVFTRNKNDLQKKKEKAVTADQELSKCVQELEEEIQRLRQKKEQAEERRDYYYQKYQDAKDAERQALMESVSKAFGFNRK